MRTALFALLLPLHAHADVGAFLDEQLPSIAETYRWFHRHPELSLEESGTARHFAELIRDVGFDVTTDVGGHGVVGVLENGEGPTVMVRCDLDALPVTEATPLPFPSSNDGVMHACGHDVHLTNVVATCRYMASHRSDCSGTIVAVAQPAEEIGAGAAAMLADGLFERFPRPDYALALHVGHDLAAGKIELRGGFTQANVDSVDITMRGRGGHGARPHQSIDPIAMAAMLVVDLQTIVAREIDPTEPAVVTVGAINGGTKHNVIPDDCHLQLTVRSYSPAVRKRLLAAIERKAAAVATSHRAAPPVVTISQGTPSLENDRDLTARLRTVFERTIGPDNVGTGEPSMGGEDFSRYGRAGVPILMYRLGSVERKRLDRYASMDLPPPSLHSAEYHPDFEPTIRTAVTTMTAALTTLMPR